VVDWPPGPGIDCGRYRRRHQAISLNEDLRAFLYNQRRDRHRSRPLGERKDCEAASWKLARPQQSAGRSIGSGLRDVSPIRRSLSLENFCVTRNLFERISQEPSDSPYQRRTRRARRVFQRLALPTRVSISRGIFSGWSRLSGQRPFWWRRSITI